MEGASLTFPAGLQTLSPN